MKPDAQPSGPLRVLPASADWLLHGTTASRSIERRALDAAAPGALMRRAARSVARLTLALKPHARHVWIAAGPGGNGGDGLHAAAELASAGRKVSLSLMADAGALPADAAEGLQRARSAGVSVHEGLHPTEHDIAIDALLGLGASRPPRGVLAAAMRALNGSTAPVLAVDLPSGLSGDTGGLLGVDAVRASWTLSLLTLKPGLFTASGRDQAGEVWFDPLGTADPDVAEAATALLMGQRPDDAWLWPRIPHDSHKGRFGDVHVVGGAAGMTGAARLAAHAAQAAGAGRTFVQLLDPQAERADSSRPEWLWTAPASAPEPAALAQAVTVCGCGGGAAIAPRLAALLADAGALVLDADALNAIAADPALEALLVGRARQDRRSILTPHPLEAARLLHTDTSHVQADRLAASQTLADRLQCVVVLKGSGTVIAAPARRPVINATGNAALASGGSGDVLAGWIAGLWAARGGPQGEAERSLDRAWRCALTACWLHGQAADEQPVEAVRGLDLIQAMRQLAGRSALGPRRA